MAVTSLWRIKGGVHKVIIYAENENKTVQGKNLDGASISVQKNGKEVARMTPKEKVNQFLSDQLLGMFPELGDLTKDDERAARVEKYESDD